MADLSPTAGSVLKYSGATVVYDGVAGDTITAGMPVYKDATDSDALKPCDADVLATAAAVGIALNGASDGQPVAYQTGGDIDLGCTLVVGVIYVVSTGAGKICPEVDLGSGDFFTLLGIAIAANKLRLNINAPGIAHA